MGLSQVFKSGRTENAAEIAGDSLRNDSQRRKGPILDNRESTKFEALNLTDTQRDFNKNRDNATILAFEQHSRIDYEDDANLMDTMINVALEKHEKRSKQNFLFDRIRAISSETKRINHNLDLGS
ncbi:hypothetical protein N9V13_05045 [Betaproteobacteria bacterium]|nr:hypothetical protein [Betaproteobacteria bacterium]